VNFCKQPARELRFRQARILVLFLIAAVVPANAQIALDTHVIAGGGGHSVSAGGCLGLDGTLGQPVAGTASGGIYAIHSGFWAGAAAVRTDSLFNTGFEGCL